MCDFKKPQGNVWPAKITIPTTWTSSVMSIRELVSPKSEYHQTLTAAIFDVDGVLLASPHEQAWREALQGFADPARFTTAIYEIHVAGKPRLVGARAALDALGVPDADRQTVAYAERKQKRLEELIHTGICRCVPRRAPLRSGGRHAGLADGRRVVLEKRKPNDAADPRSTVAEVYSMSSAPMSAVAICGRASPTRKFSCSPPRSCA